MVTKVEKINIPSLFKEIQSHIDNDEHESVLKISNEILENSNTDKEALRCKIISLIQLGKYKECSEYIKSKNSEKIFAEEYCYCFIETKEYDSCYKFLDSLDQNENTDLIKAQLDYKTGNYKSAYTHIKKLINTDNNLENEDYLTNFLSLYYLSGQNEDITFITKNMNSWETFFNYCLVLLNQGKFGDSMETLLRMDNLKTDDDYNELKYKNLQFSIIQTVFDGFEFSKTTNLQEEYSKFLKNDKNPKHKNFMPYFYNNYLQSKLNSTKHISNER